MPCSAHLRNWHAGRANAHAQNALHTAGRARGYAHTVSSLQVPSTAAPRLLRTILAIRPQIIQNTIHDVPCDSFAGAQPARGTIEAAVEALNEGEGAAHSTANGGAPLSSPLPSPRPPLFTLTGGNSAFVVLPKAAQRHVSMWDDIVAPALSCSTLFVESWLHGPGRLDDNCGGLHCIVNADGMEFGASHWDVYQDHAKWGICCNKAQACFGDLNREVSQARRAGLTVCVMDAALGSDDSVGRGLAAWLAQHAIVRLSPRCLKACSCARQM